MNILQLDHVAVHVADLAASKTFYSETMRLAPLDRPDFDFPGAWFRLGTTQELHLIGDRSDAINSHHRGNHFAFRVTEVDSWQSHFESQGIAFIRKTRPDGASQIFLQDPDGYWVELTCDG